MRKLIAAATIVVAGVGIGGSVFAGEVTGNGDPTPVARPRAVASSICAFSGLDDGSETTPPTLVKPGVVQTFGSELNAFLDEFELDNASAVAQELRYIGPGTECRGN